MFAMDRISRLPDEVLQHILSFLPTKYAVGTSLLSTRWMDLWVPLPVLDFDNSLCLRPQRKRFGSNNLRQKDLFRDFVDMVLSVNDSPNITKLRLCIDIEDQEDLSYVNEWIQTILQRDVVELDISITDRNTICKDSLQITRSQSLQVLRIESDCGFHMPTSGDCFPNIRIFDFKGTFEYVEDELTKRLFPSLPRLERLSLSGEITSEMESISFNITGTALKSIEVDLWEESETIYVDDYNFQRRDCDIRVVIDAPHLEYLRLKDGFLVDYSIKNLPPSCEVKLDVNLVDVGEMITYNNWDGDYVDDIIDVPFGAFYPNQSSIQLMQEICNAKSLSVSATTTRALMNATEKNLPVFHLLTKLEITLHTHGWNLFMQWLDSCPNLQFLVLRKQEYAEQVFCQVKWTALESVPTCLLLHLKEVKINGLRKQEEDKILKYLRANAKVLEKITVNSHLIKM